MKLSKLTGGADRMWQLERDKLFPPYLLPANDFDISIRIVWHFLAFEC